MGRINALPQLSAATFDFRGDSDVHSSIKEARREDDPRFSQGVWQTPLKKADWPEVERLCALHLQHSSEKLDGQVLGWFLEAWCAQDGLPGLVDGLGYLKTGLAQMPSNLDEEDAEAWDVLIHWMDRLLADRLVQEPLIPNLVPLTLAQWVSTIQLENALGRASDKEKTSIQAQLAKQKSTRHLRGLIQDHTQMIQGAIQEGEAHLEVLRSLVPGGWRALTQHFLQIKEIVAPITRETGTSDLGGDQRELQALLTETSSAIPTVPDIYEQLRSHAETLAILEPQGIVHLFLKKLLAYKGCSQIEFFQLLSEKPEDIQVFLRFLGVSSSKV